MNSLSEESKKYLLMVARKSIEEKFKGKLFEPKDIPDELNFQSGCFVSLHDENKNLRGCIGNFRNDINIVFNVRDMAIEAAFSDPRFAPLRRDELEKIDIEISVLTPMQRVRDIEEIVVGKDGLYVVKGFFRGVLLPQVAVQHGWDKYEFLSYTCMKAGLPFDEWKKSDIDIYKFQAIIFDEVSLGLKEVLNY
ncbi:AmmeMemoRadiSam system protein A [Deferribacter autotrophicus]|uniref:AmmeMemoRadiSam system protein A n=1 Tax=Deferribacter autotrophicus TaxID=500465 RepID=A0A5A8F4D2_9BACT|nr:AmmeMemoRadiSam system protein A [Deferribacter autotrophicus]KAA0257945.1 AmmeMemoRadiSam system protein A [Deferribacter autotrophicus]